MLPGRLTRVRLHLVFLCFTLVPAFAQTPKVGLVEIFGAHKTSPEKIRRALGVIEGGPLPSSKGEVEERLESLDEVVRATVEAICCLDKQAVLYVGIEEKGAPHFELRPPPDVEIVLPEEVMKEWMDFTGNLAIAVRKGTAEEDLTAGHSLVADLDARANQLRFLELAEAHYPLLREVMRSAADSQHRAVAAYVIGYAKDKKRVAEDLQYAMRDDDSTVRVNAMRGLVAITIFASKQPDLGIRIPPTWFVEMLNSTHFTDRLKAADALYNFTEKRDESILSHLRERALPALIEMSGWHEPNHAISAFILLGRVAGLPEPEIQELWKNAGRPALLKKLKDSAKSRN